MVFLQYRVVLCMVLLAGIQGSHAFVSQPHQTLPKHHASLTTSVSKTSRQQGYAHRTLMMPSKPMSEQTYGRISTQRQIGLATFQEPVIKYFTSLLSNTGGVPFAQAFSVNALGISLLLKPLSKMLTGDGILHALILGTSLWKTLGWRGWSVCVAYLFAGSLVTKIGFKKKDKLGIAEGRGGKRGPENLWGSAATGLACAICSRLGPSFLGVKSELFVLAYVASLATKLADTFASEIGKAYGKTTFLITNFKRVEPGTEGAVSLEGTLAAVLGGFLLSSFGYGMGLIKCPRGVAISTAAAFWATNAESVLGATVQGKKGMEWMTNEVINFFNTLIGAGLTIAGGLYYLV